jgi:hypothetical protein
LIDDFDYCPRPFPSNIPAHCLVSINVRISGYFSSSGKTCTSTPYWVSEEMHCQMAILRLGVVSSVSARAMVGACIPPGVGESRVLAQLPELRSLVTSIVHNASCLFQDLVLVESRYCKTKKNHLSHVLRPLIWSRTAPYCLKMSS